MTAFGLIAGKGGYPLQLLANARRKGEKRVVVAAFEGETDPAVGAGADAIEWMRVGQLGRLVKFFTAQGVDRAVMAGQITPARLYDLRPDIRALVLLARLKKRNAESLFGAVAGELEKAGVRLLPAHTHMEEALAAPGHVAGPRPPRHLAEDIEFGWPLAKQISAMDIGQSIVVKRGTVLAVEGYDGTNETIRRGGAIGGTGSVLIKVSKPGQDMRFDIPVIGSETIRIAAESGVHAIVCEAGKTLLLDLEETRRLAQSLRVSIHGN